MKNKNSFYKTKYRELKKLYKTIKYLSIRYIDEVSFWLVWWLSMFILLVAIIGDNAEKELVLILFMKISSFLVKLYSFFGGVLLLVIIALVIMWLILRIAYRID